MVYLKRQRTGRSNLRFRHFNQRTPNMFNEKIKRSLRARHSVCLGKWTKHLHVANKKEKNTNNVNT